MFKNRTDRDKARCLKKWLMARPDLSFDMVCHLCGVTPTEAKRLLRQYMGIYIK